MRDTAIAATSSAPHEHRCECGNRWLCFDDDCTEPEVTCECDDCLGYRDRMIDLAIDAYREAR